MEEHQAHKMEAQLNYIDLLHNNNANIESHQWFSEGCCIVLDNWLNGIP